MVDETFLGLAADSLPTSRPMVNNANNGVRGEVETPSIIQLQFDTIAYQKSGSVMMMIRGIIGDELWTQALRSYQQGMQYKNAGWRELLSYFDEATIDIKESKLNGKTMTEIMQPYFRQMGYPALKFEGKDSVKITTNRYFAAQTDDLYPESEFEYKWDFPIILKNIESGDERIVWLEQTGGSRDAQTVFDNIEIDSREIINPNGNMFCRMKFTDDYVKMLMEAHKSDTELEARYIAKMMQDAYRMFNEQRDIYGVTLRHILNMASFLDGPESTQDRWIVWREMTNNVYPKINRLMTANLNSEGGDHAELLKIYKKFMNDKVDYFISEFYPDKGCSSGKDYDLSRARMTPFVLDYAMNYADSKNSTVFSDAHDLAMETVNRCPFLDQSPDTRQKNF